MRAPSKLASQTAVTVTQTRTRVPLAVAAAALLFSLSLASACQATKRSRQCSELASTVNATLERVEEAYREAGPQGVDWRKITNEYRGLSARLREHPPSDRRLGQVVTEYANVLSAAAGTTRALESADSKQQAGKHAEELRRLRDHAVHHRRVSLKIDRLCRN